MFHTGLSWVRTRELRAGRQKCSWDYIKKRLKVRAIKKEINITQHQSWNSKNKSVKIMGKRGTDKQRICDSQKNLFVLQTQIFKSLSLGHLGHTVCQRQFTAVRKDRDLLGTLDGVTMTLKIADRQTVGQALIIWMVQYIRITCIRIFV